MSGPEDVLPADFDRRLQRQLLSMDEDEARGYAHLMGGLIEKMLAAPDDPVAPSAPAPPAPSTLPGVTRRPA